MNWLRQQLRASLAALRQLGAHPIATLLTTLAIGVAISLPSGLYLLLNNLERLAGDLPAQPEISLYLDTDIPTAERDAVAARIKQHPSLASYRYIPRDVALQALGEAQQLADITADQTADLDFVAFREDQRANRIARDCDQRNTQ